MLIVNEILQGNGLENGQFREHRCKITRTLPRLNWMSMGVPHLDGHIGLISVQLTTGVSNG